MGPIDPSKHAKKRPENEGMDKPVCFCSRHALSLPTHSREALPLPAAGNCRGGRKVRATQSAVLPNGKIFERG